MPNSTSRNGESTRRNPRTARSSLCSLEPASLSKLAVPAFEIRKQSFVRRLESQVKPYTERIGPVSWIRAGTSFVHLRSSKRSEHRKSTEHQNPTQTLSDPTQPPRRASSRSTSQPPRRRRSTSQPPSSTQQTRPSRPTRCHPDSSDPGCRRADGSSLFLGFGFGGTEREREGGRAGSQREENASRKRERDRLTLLVE